MDQLDEFDRKILVNFQTKLLEKESNAYEFCDYILEFEQNHPKVFAYIITNVSYEYFIFSLLDLFIGCGIPYETFFHLIDFYELDLTKLNSDNQNILLYSVMMNYDLLYQIGFLKRGVNLNQIDKYNKNIYNYIQEHNLKYLYYIIQNHIHDWILNPI